MNIEGGNTFESSQDIDDMLASFSPEKSTGAEKIKEQRKAPRFRVKWHAEIIIDDQIAYHGFINDSSLHIEKCTLRIHVPPLNLKIKPHIMEVFGRIIYVVYDGEKQLFRAAINFLGFNPESDQPYLGERLTKHQIKIPEFC